MTEIIKIEENHLIIYRGKDGKFRRFEWHPYKLISREELEAKILEYNKKEPDRLLGQDATCELITDQLTKEICAYRQRGRLYESIIQDAKEIQGSINKAVDILENAISDLNRIKGIE